MKSSLLASLLASLLVLISAIGAVGQTSCSDLFISEYVEGSGNNRAIELYNPTGNAIDLSQYQMGRFRDGSGSPMVFTLSGVIQPYDTYVVALDKRDPNGTGNEAPIEAALEAVADTFVNPVYVQANSPFYFNGDDAFGLFTSSGTVLVDLIGKIGVDPGTAWSDQNGVWWTIDHTLVRKPEVQVGVTANPSEFLVELEWDSLPVNTFSNLGWHVCDCPACPPTFSTTTVSTCGSYSWNNVSYNQSGIYTYQTINSSGCDSVATLNLSIIPNFAQSETHALCGGETVTVGGTTYSQEGQYTQLIPGSNSCDTLLTINIQTDDEPGVSILGNTVISPNSGEDYAFVDPENYTITWSAVNGTVISGQGTPLATIFWDATGGGEVAVTLTNNNCTYTYTLAVGTFVSVENHWINDLKIHPNPSSGIFNIELSGPAQIKVMDSRGRRILETNGNGRFTLDLSAFPNGTYSVQLRTETGVGVKRLVKY